MALAALCAFVAPAAADAASYQAAELTFTKSRPGASTGLRFEVDYANPAAPQAQPPPVRRVVLEFAPGTTIDTGAPERCGAGDLELMLGGASFCPAATQVGNGHVVVDTGLPGVRFVEAEIDFLNNDHELIYVNTVQGTPARTIIRARVGRRTVETVVPPLPGAPPDGGAIDTAVTHFPALSSSAPDGERRNYVSTPERCPRRGYWVNRMRFSYDGGVTQTVKTRAPCRRRGRS